MFTDENWKPLQRDGKQIKSYAAAACNATRALEQEWIVETFVACACIWVYLYYKRDGEHRQHAQKLGIIQSKSQQTMESIEPGWGVVF